MRLFARHFVLIVSSLLLCSTLYAHESRPAYLALTETAAETYDVVWKVPAKGRFTKLALEIEFDEQVKTVMSKTSEFSGGAVVERWTIHRPGGLAGSSIAIGGLDSTLTDALIRIEDLEGLVQTIRVGPDNPRFDVQAEPGPGEVASVYTYQGVKHIWRDRPSVVCRVSDACGRARAEIVSNHHRVHGRPFTYTCIVHAQYHHDSDSAGRGCDCFEHCLSGCRDCQREPELVDLSVSDDGVIVLRFASWVRVCRRVE